MMWWMERHLEVNGSGGYPLLFWMPSISKWWPVIHLMAWDGDSWVQVK